MDRAPNRETIRYNMAVEGGRVKGEATRSMDGSADTRDKDFRSEKVADITKE